MFFLHIFQNRHCLTSKNIFFKFNLIDTYEPIVFNILELECEIKMFCVWCHLCLYVYCSAVTWHLLYHFVVNTNGILIGINLLNLSNKSGWVDYLNKNNFCWQLIRNNKRQEYCYWQCLQWLKRINLNLSDFIQLITMTMWFDFLRENTRILTNTWRMLFLALCI